MTQAESFTLPTGATVEMRVREGTNDHNVCYSILTEDEYRLPRGIAGVAVDVGAHIGAATVGLLELNPELRVIAIEPVPENFELLARNTERYGDRVERIQAAAGTNPIIRYGFKGDEPARVHRYIGNQHMPPGTPFEEVSLPTISLSQIVGEYGPIAFLKLDCEGCEYSFLNDPAVEQVAEIAGEWHDGPAVELRHWTKPTAADIARIQRIADEHLRGAS